ncbi:Ttll1, partial [Symbiodinium pilosum]
GGPVGADFNYVPLFAGGLSREDALSMLWAGAPPEELDLRGAFPKSTQVVDKVLK